MYIYVFTSLYSYIYIKIIIYTVYTVYNNNMLLLLPQLEKAKCKIIINQFHTHLEKSRNREMWNPTAIR